MYTGLTPVLSRYCMWVLLKILKMCDFHPLRIPDLYFAIIEGVPFCDKEPQHSVQLQADKGLHERKKEVYLFCPCNLGICTILELHSVVSRPNLSCALQTS